MTGRDSFANSLKDGWRGMTSRTYRREVLREKCDDKSIPRSGDDLLHELPYSALHTHTHTHAYDTVAQERKQRKWYHVRIHLLASTEDHAHRKDGCRK